MSEIKDILSKNSFRFKKQFGQNFITDTNLLTAIADDSDITKFDHVAEIGAGAGTLTRILAEKAGQVTAFEIDKDLKPILSETLSPFGNVNLLFGDILKFSDSELFDLLGKDYKVVANLPYYITSPIIMRFLELENPPKSLTVMLQKEVAERLVANPNTPQYSGFTAVCNLYGTARITRIVGRQMFLPVPDVDSAVLRIDTHDRFSDIDKVSVSKFINACFSMRRKTLINNLTKNYAVPKDKAINVLASLGIDERVRAEVLSVEQFVELFNALK